MWKHTDKQELSRAVSKAAREKNSMSENSQKASAEQPQEPAGTSNKRPQDGSQLGALNTEEKPHVSAARDERKWG